MPITFQGTKQEWKCSQQDTTHTKSIKTVKYLPETKEIYNTLIILHKKASLTVNIPHQNCTGNEESYSKHKLNKTKSGFPAVWF